MPLGTGGTISRGDDDVDGQLQPPRPDQDQSMNGRDSSGWEAPSTPPGERSAPAEDEAA